MDEDVMNVDRLLETFDELWAPRIVAVVNDWAVKIARVQGEFVWHRHVDTDEVFLIKEGALAIDVRDGTGERTVSLGMGDCFVVPRGMEHRPRSAEGAVVFLVEPAATLSTGDFTGPVPAHITATRGISA